MHTCAASPLDCYSFVKCKGNKLKICSENGRSFCRCCSAFAHEHGPLSSTHTAGPMILAAGVAADAGHAMMLNKGYVANALPTAARVGAIVVQLFCWNLLMQVFDSIQSVGIWEGRRWTASHRRCNRVLVPAQMHRHFWMRNRHHRGGWHCHILLSTRPAVMQAPCSQSCAWRYPLAMLTLLNAAHVEVVCILR